LGDCRTKARSCLRSAIGPVTLLERIKVAANKRDVPYQSLIKTWLAEKTGTR
jgi:predicted DNA binding CopG/RHH family protein